MLFNNIDSTYMIDDYDLFKLVPEIMKYNVSYQNITEILNFFGKMKAKPLAKNKKIITLEFTTNLHERKYLLDFYFKKYGTAYSFWLPLYDQRYKIIRQDTDNTMKYIIEASGFVESFKGYEKICNLIYDEAKMEIRNIIDYGVINYKTEYIVLDGTITITKNRFLTKMIYGRFRDELNIEIRKTNINNYILHAKTTFVETDEEIQ